jgi:uncharacterized protein (TIGR02147 family)
MVNMAIYQFDSYKTYLNQWVTSQSKGGHGEYRRLALALKVSTTLISQVFKGDKNLSMEMAAEVCDYLNLNEEEADYFLLLVEYEKAGSTKLRGKLKRQIVGIQEKAKKVENRIKKDIELTDEAKAVFYSSWMYSAVRIISALEQYNDVASISERLHIDRNHVQKIVDFLVQHQLCSIENRKIRVGKTKTFLEKGSPFAVRSHQNWRMLGFQKMTTTNDDHFFFTAPMAVSRKVMGQVRQELPDLIERVYKIAGPSDSEVPCCLSIDWFDF